MTEVRGTPTALNAPDATHALLTTSMNIGVLALPELYKTSDAGHTWQPVAFPRTLQAPAASSAAAKTARPSPAPDALAPFGAAAAAPCTAADLSITVGPPGSAAGTFGFDITFKNTSKVTCTLTGYATVRGSSSTSGESAPLAQTPHGGMGGLPQGIATPSVVTLTSGASAIETVEGGNPANVQPSQECSVYESLLITIPNDSRTVTLADQSAGPIPVCPASNTQIHPFLPAASAHQT